MNIKQKIGQMIMLRASGHLFDRQRRYPVWEADNNTLKKWLTQLNIGGVILLGGSAVELKQRIKYFQDIANIPLFIAADIEEGVGQRFSGATWFPPPMALSAIAKKDINLAKDYASKMGAITASEAIAIGINWLLAPVVDVNNNPDNPVINIRSFGDRVEIVSQLTKAFIKGTKEYNILTTAKHFPGHGDTSTDSHLDLPSIPHDDLRLREIELVPFIDAISMEVDSIMTAHLKIESWDKKYPVTLSSNILKNLLRKELNFQGLIITDALIMGGMTKFAPPEEIAVRAILAGADILLMPDNPEVAIDSIYNAIVSGKITQARINKSIERIEKAKSQLGLVKEKINKEISLTDNLSQPLSLITATEILEQSLQKSDNLPLQIIDRQNLRNLIVVDDLLNSNFLDITTPAITIPQKLGYQRQIVDRHNCINTDNRKTLLQVFIRGNPFRGIAGLTDSEIKQYLPLLNSDLLSAIIIYGSPYVKDWFIQNIRNNLPWVFVYGQMDLAQELAITTLFNLDTENIKVAPPLSNKTIDNFGF